MLIKVIEVLIIYFCKKTLVTFSFRSKVFLKPSFFSLIENRILAQPSDSQTVIWVCPRPVGNGEILRPFFLIFGKPRRPRQFLTSFFTSLCTSDVIKQYNTAIIAPCEVEWFFQSQRLRASCISELWFCFTCFKNSI